MRSPVQSRVMQVIAVYYEISIVRVIALLLACYITDLPSPLSSVCAAVHVCAHMLKLHWFDLMWICCTTSCTENPQQVKFKSVMVASNWRSK